MDLYSHGEVFIKAADATFPPGQFQALAIERYLDDMADIGLEPVTTEYQDNGWAHVFVAAPAMR